MGLITDMLGFALGALLLVLALSAVFSLGGVALYVLQALGLYTLGQNRGLGKSWMAWVPVLNLWVLGSLSDQYRYVVHRQVRNRRKVMLTLSILGAVLSLVYSVLYTGGVIELLMGMPQLQNWQETLYMLRLQPMFLATAGISAIAAAVNLLLAVFRWVCLYDVYASSRPDRKVLFTVLSVFLPVTVPFFLFACRNRDGGMPPRRA